MNVQAPPNLSPHQIELFLHAGINDWGGISPLSKDYVNPEAPWPHLERLASNARGPGFRACASGSQFIPNTSMMNGSTRRRA